MLGFRAIPSIDLHTAPTAGAYPLVMMLSSKEASHLLLRRQNLTRSGKNRTWRLRPWQSFERNSRSRRKRLCRRRNLRRKSHSTCQHRFLHQLWQAVSLLLQVCVALQRRTRLSHRRTPLLNQLAIVLAIPRSLPNPSLLPPPHRLFRLQAQLQAYLHHL